MIRFRTGQGWRRERATAPHDAFGLEVDGLDLLALATDEPLDQVILELAEALSALGIRGERCAQLSLPESHLELVLRRLGDEVELWVVSLGRPARLLHQGVRVDLTELVDAAVNLGAQLVGEDGLPLSASARRKVARRLAELEAGPLVLEAPSKLEGRTERTVPPPQAGGFGFVLFDERGHAAAFHPKQGGPLGSLLSPGALLFGREGETILKADCIPFLAVLELQRQAQDLVHALELGDAKVELRPGGVGPELSVDFRAGKVRAEGAELAVPATALVRSMFEVGQALNLAFTELNRAQAQNPYLVDLVQRAKEATPALEAPAQTTEPGSARAKQKAKGAKDKPLQTQGKLRRLRFDRRWRREVGAHEKGALILAKKGPIFSCAERCAAFDREGAPLYAYSSPQGVATNADAQVLVTTLERVAAFDGGAPSARWIRDHDGLPLGPELRRQDGLWVVCAQARAALAFSELTGRELWRLAPPRTQRVHLSVQGHRALLATDAGYLYGLDLEDGQVRYRMRSAMPFTAAAVPWGRKMLATIGRGERSVLMCADAHSGKLAWAKELDLANLSRPVVVGQRVLVAAEQEHEGVLCCLSSKGKLLWERRLHLGKGPFCLLPLGSQILAVNRTGAAAVFGPEGNQAWRLGAPGEEVAALVTPALSRGVLVLPGESVRAVDPKGGRVLAEVRVGPGLCDLKADARLNLYALDEEGTLTAFRLVTSLSVVEPS